MHREAPDELVRVKPHRLAAARAVDAIVLATERDAGVVGGNEAAVRYGGQHRIATPKAPAGLVAPRSGPR